MTPSKFAATTTFECPMVHAERLDVEFVAKWYSTLGRIDFINAVAGSTSLIEGICGMQVSLELIPQDGFSSPAAGAISFETVPPRMMISPIFISNALDIWPEELRPLASLGACNGTIIHESLHAKYTKEAHESFMNLPMKSQRDAFQIIEDLYIETMCADEFPYLYRFITLKNAFLFSSMADKLWVKGRDVFDGSFAKFLAQYLPLVKYFRGQFGAFVTNFSRGEFVDGDLIKAVMNVLNKAMQVRLSVATRIALAKELAALLYGTEIGEEDIDKIAASFKFHVNHCRPSKSLFGKSDEKAETEDMDKGEGSDSDDGEDAGDTEGDDDDSSYIRPKESDLESLGEISNELRRASLEGACLTISGMQVFGLQVAPTGEKVSLVVPETKLAKHLRQVQTPRTTYGEPRTSGRIASTRLWRVATDSKIFAEPMHIDRSARSYEFAIGVDASGSMGKVFFKQVLLAAAGIKRDINEGGFNAQLFAFTADLNLTSDAKNCVNYLIGGPNYIPLNDFRQLLMSAMYNIRLLENRDNLTIEWATKSCFSERKETTKILLMLSDGAPSATAFRGEGAINATKAVIDRARKDGFIVIGVSLKDEVVYKNDHLYGPKFHVVATNPDTLGEDIAKKINSLFES